MQQASGRTFFEPKLILRLVIAFIIGVAVGLAGWNLLTFLSSNGSPPSFFVYWIPTIVVGGLLSKKYRQLPRLTKTTIICLSLGFVVVYIGAGLGGGSTAHFLLFGVLGPLLALTCVLLLAWGIGAYWKHRWLLALTCGLLGALGMLLATLVISARDVLDARFIAITGLTVAACALAGEFLRHLYETTQEARQHAAQAAGTPSTVSRTLSRRAMLLGLAGGSALMATGAGFSWLTRAYLSHFTPLLTHKQYASVLALAWSPDGSRIASGSQSGEVQVWYAADGRDALTLNSGNPTTPGLDALAWSPDSQRLLIAGNGQIVEIWETSSPPGITNRPVQNLGIGSAAAAWSPDGSAIAFFDGAAIDIWSAGSEQTILTINTPHSSALAWSPDGRSLASANDGAVQVWDAQSGALLLEYDGHNGLVRSIAWSPDGTLVASGDDAGSIQVWQASSGARISSAALDDYEALSPTALAWSPDGQRLASGGGIDGAVDVWNPRTGQRSFRYTGHTQDVNTIAWSPNGRFIASGGEDQTVQVWQPE
jgi:WD40 repeat protein